MHLIGSTALMLQTDYDRGTKDGDVLETAELGSETQKRLLAVAGARTPLSAKHRMYVEIVPHAIPFLPQVPSWHPADLSLTNFEVFVLDVVDVVVSKLKRLNDNDLADIDAMVTRGLIPHERLLQRFREVVDYFSCDARAEDLPRFVANLHRIERDMLDVAETDIELPSWI